MTKKSKNKATNYKSVREKIKPVKELPSILSMLVYGRSGTGKTTFGGTWPKPILLLDVKEKGTDSIKNVDEVKVLPLTEWDEFEQIYWLLKKADHPYKSVIVDTVTQLQEIAKAKVLKDNNKDSSDNPSRNDWGSITGLMKRWIIEYRDLNNINKLFIAQDRTDSEDTAEEDQIIPEVGPAVSPSVASTLNAAVKVIGHSYIKEVEKRTKKGLKSVMKYRLRLGPHTYYLTKIRNPKEDYTPSYITNPTYQKVVDIVKGDYKEKLKKKKEKLKKKKQKKPNN